MNNSKTLKKRRKSALSIGASVAENNFMFSTMFHMLKCFTCSASCVVLPMNMPTPSRKHDKQWLNEFLILAFHFLWWCDDESVTMLLFVSSSSLRITFECLIMVRTWQSFTAYLCMLISTSKMSRARCTIMQKSSSSSSRTRKWRRGRRKRNSLIPVNFADSTNRTVPSSPSYNQFRIQNNLFSM